MAREHVTDSLDCWCEPELFQPCRRCEVERAAEESPDERCPVCRGRGFESAYDGSRTIIAVHSDGLSHAVVARKKS